MNASHLPLESYKACSLHKSGDYAAYSVVVGDGLHLLGEKLRIHKGSTVFSESCFLVGQVCLTQQAPHPELSTQSPTPDALALNPYFLALSEKRGTVNSVEHGSPKCLGPWIVKS